MSRVTRRLVRFACLAATLAIAGPRLAHGADDAVERARTAYDAAERAFGLGRFDEARALYQQAYEIKALPGFLFNVGQCHRNLGHWERARFFYERYLSGDPKARNRDKVVLLIEQMQQKEQEVLERERGAAAAANITAAASITAAAPAPAAGPAGLATPADARAAVRPSPDSGTPAAARRPAHKSWWVWTIVGAVVAGTATGIGVALTQPSVSATNLTGSLGDPIDARR